VKFYLESKISTFPLLRFILPFILSLIIVCFLFLIGMKKFGPETGPSQRDQNVLFNTTSGKSKLYPLVSDSHVRNVILFIGDGMGLSHIAVTRIHLLGPEGRLNIERMPVTGLVNTHSLNNLVTDSAAGGTALATGFKTHNDMVSFYPDQTKLPTILEGVMREGLHTGLVATSAITHSTPACFAAHTIYRGEQSSVAIQFIEKKVNVLLGGGKEYFIPKSLAGSKRTDEIDLIRQAKAKGYSVVETREELQTVRGDYVLGLFQLGHLRSTPPEPTLAELTAKAIEIVNQNKKGFFLMIEGSKIDWGAHAQDIEYVMRELLFFDEAVKIGLEFAQKDKHTLVVVTSDHETGGLSIVSGSQSSQSMGIRWNTFQHTGQQVPLFAFGPHALRFTGVKDNTDIPKIVAELLNIELSN